MVDCFVVVLLCNAALVVSVLSAPPSGRLKQRSVSALPPRRNANGLRMSLRPTRFLATACPEGEVLTNGVCQPCPSGMYWKPVENGVAKCLKCPLGTFSLKGVKDVAECNACPLGFYADTEGSTICKSCGPSTTTLLSRATSSDACLCDAGYRLRDPTRRQFVNEALDCVLCENYEWCVPGFDTSYWNVDQLCNSAEESQSSLCTLNNGSVSTAFLGKCIRPDECPSLYDISQNQNKAQCRFPNRGVKCHGCASPYGRSLLSGPTGGCTSCIWHYVVFSCFLIFGSLWVVWVSTMLSGRDVSDPSKGVVLMRTFLQHWQHLAILRYMNVAWPKAIQTPMQIITMGVPFVDILSCFFMAQNGPAQQFLLGIQILCFFPLGYLLWCIILALGMHQCADWLKLKCRKKKKTGLVASESSVPAVFPEAAPSGVLQRRSSILLSLWSSRGPDAREGSPMHLIRIFTNFAILYQTFFVSFASGLFYGIQCVFVEATGLYHSFAALDQVCSNNFETYPWSVVGISLWVWAIPLCFIVLMWFRADHWSDGKKYLGCGYFLHGYRRATLLWQSVVLLRIMVMVTIAGLSGPYDPEPLLVEFGTRELYIHQLPPKSDYGCFSAMLSIALVYLITEMLREFFSVAALGAAGQFLPLSRVSMASIMLTLFTAGVSKLHTTGTLGLSITENTSDKGVRVDGSVSSYPKTKLANETSVAYYCATVLGILCLVGHVCFVLSALYNVFSLVHLHHWFSVKMSGMDQHSRLSVVAFRSALRNGVKQLLQLLPSSSKEQSFSTLPFLTSQHQQKQTVVTRLFPSFLAPTSKLPTPFSQLKRTIKIKVALKEEARVAEACIESGHTGDYGQVIAALLRLTLEPYGRVDTLSKCIQLLSDEGFDLITVEKPVTALLDLRSRVAESLERLRQEKLVRPSWIARQYTLLRYPVLEDPSLQLIPPFKHETKISKRLSTLNSGKANAATQIPFGGVKGCVRRCGTVWLRGRVVSKPEELLRTFSALLVPGSRAISAKAALVQELTQRVVQCLLLDLSDTRYAIPRSVVIDRFLAAGVPPGARNDGKTDSAIREFQSELQRLEGENQSKERPQQEVELGRILRTRRAVYEEAIKAQRYKTPVKVLAALQYAENINQEQRRRRELEATVQGTANFITLFPDARRVRHGITGKKDGTPDPKKMVRIFQDKTVFPADEPVKKDENESFTTYIGKVLREVQRQIESYTKSNVAPLSNGTDRGGTAEERSSADTSSAVPLLVLMCVAGEFSVEPAEVNVFLAGKPQFVEGPDGTLTGISTDSAGETEVLHDVDVVQVKGTSSAHHFALLDPIVEIAAPVTGDLVRGEAEWTLECWIFLPKTFGQQDVISGVFGDKLIRTLCASEAGESLLSLSLEKRVFGMWNPKLEPGCCFESFGPLGTAVHAVTLEELEIPCWHFATVATECRRQDPSDPASGIVVVHYLYIDGKLSGGLRRNWVIRDIDVIGNNVNGSQAFGTFANLCILAGCLSSQEVEKRYRERRQAAEDRLYAIRRARKKLNVLKGAASQPKLRKRREAKTDSASNII